MAHKTNSTQPLFIEVPVTSQESKRPCIDVLGVLILSHSTIFRLDFATEKQTRKEVCPLDNYGQSCFDRSDLKKIKCL